jgi:uncharacterized membrane protein
VTVASISASGELKPLKAGTTSISATSTLDSSKKDSFNLTVTTTLPPSPTLKITATGGTTTTAGGASIVLLAVKPDQSDTVTWSFVGTALGKLSATTGDSVTYTPPANGTGSDTIKATAGSQEASVTITITAPPTVANRIQGTIEDWTKTATVSFSAYSDQYETLANDNVSANGQLDMTLLTPKKLADLDSSVDATFCNSSNALRSEPATLEGAFVYSLESNDGFVTQRSFVAGQTPLDGQGYVFRAYSRESGKVTGSCVDYSGLKLTFDINLTAGWNLVQAIYSEGNREFIVEETATLPANMKLEYESYTISPVNQFPVAYLYTYAGWGVNEVLFDASYSYDPDGYIAYWSLDLGDGTVLDSSTYGSISNIYNFSHYYASSGYYPVNLTVCDYEGACSYAYAEAYAY